MQAITRGKLIFIEGCDGSGKSTASSILQTKLKEQGKPIETAAILRDDDVSFKIREILTTPGNVIHPDTEACLYAAAVTNVYRHKVIPLLEKGVNVICDRSQLSTWAYQVQPQTDKGNMRPLEIYNAAYVGIEGFSPDILVIMTVDAETGLKRVAGRDGKLDRLELKGPAFQEEVQQAFLAYGALVAKDHPVLVYQNTGDIVELSQFIDQVVSLI